LRDGRLFLSLNDSDFVVSDVQMPKKTVVAVSELFGKVAAQANSTALGIALLGGCDRQVDQHARSPKSFVRPASIPAGGRRWCRLSGWISGGGINLDYWSPIQADEVPGMSGLNLPVVDAG
jgi:hypothetical protein